MSTYFESLDNRFLEEGSIKERMHAAHTGYREGVNRRLRELEEENRQLKKEIAKLKAEIEDSKKS